MFIVLCSSVVHSMCCSPLSIDEVILILLVNNNTIDSIDDADGYHENLDIIPIKYSIYCL